MIASWALGVMLTMAPPGRSLIPDAVETEEQGRDRYAEIARAIAEESNGSKRTAALLLAVSYKESGWRRDVDFGIGPKARGSGKDSCLMQIRSDDPRLVADRSHCFATGLRMIRQSMNACRHLPREAQLAAYAAGTCISTKGQQASRIRITLADRILALPLD